MVLRTCSDVCTKTIAKRVDSSSQTIDDVAQRTGSKRKLMTSLHNSTTSKNEWSGPRNSEKNLVLLLAYKKRS